MAVTVCLFLASLCVIKTVRVLIASSRAISCLLSSSTATEAGKGAFQEDRRKAWWQGGLRLNLSAHFGLSGRAHLSTYCCHAFIQGYCARVLLLSHRFFLCATVSSASSSTSDYRFRSLVCYYFIERLVLFFSLQLSMLFTFGSAKNPGGSVRVMMQVAFLSLTNGKINAICR